MLAQHHTTLYKMYFESMKKHLTEKNTIKAKIENDSADMKRHSSGLKKIEADLLHEKVNKIKKSLIEVEEESHC